MEDIRSFLVKIKSSIENGDLNFNAHHDLKGAYFLIFQNEKGQKIEYTLDKYRAIFRTKMAPCVNLYISIDNAEKKNIVRCEHSDGQFKEEYDLLNDIFELVDSKEKSKATLLQSLFEFAA